MEEYIRKTLASWRYNIRKDFLEIRCEYIDWTHLAEDKDQLQIN
jgi:hypothetical protein